MSARRQATTANTQAWLRRNAPLPPTIAGWERYDGDLEAATNTARQRLLDHAVDHGFRIDQGSISVRLCAARKGWDLFGPGPSAGDVVVAEARVTGRRSCLP